MRNTLCSVQNLYNTRVFESYCLVSTRWTLSIFLTLFCVVACQCSPLGSRHSICEPTTGQCECQTNVTGRQCDRCISAAPNFPYCEGNAWDGKFSIWFISPPIFTVGFSWTFCFVEFCGNSLKCGKGGPCRESQGVHIRWVHSSFYM